jgi:hypothetical protein
MDLDKHEQLLAGMVMQYQQLAMMALGKMPRPDGKIHRDLQEASFFIDMIDMLFVKTEGNVAEEVKEILHSSLADLRLNYVDEAAKPDEKSASSTPAAEEAGKEEVKKEESAEGEI